MTPSSNLYAEEVPEPTNEDVAERLVKRLMILCQKREWDIAGENLKVNINLLKNITSISRHIYRL